MAAKLNYRKLVPTGSFIDQYMEAQSTIETPESYDFFCALWLMSLALGRNVYIDRPNAPVMLNMYVILAADSGVTRKSTAVKRATQLAKQLLPTLDNKMLVIEGKTTPEMLEYQLHKLTEQNGYAHVAISISELVTFLGREKYNISMPGLLTDLYDCPRERSSPGTLSRGSSIIENVYVSFLSASTPNWLVRAVNPDVIEGGFTSRCFFVHEETRKRRIAWTDVRSRSIGDLLVSLRSTTSKQRRGDVRTVDEQEAQRITISPSGLKVFTNWYNSREEHRDPFRASFESREDAHVLRIAAFLCVNDGSWILQTAHIKSAIRIVTTIKESGARIFEGAGLQSKLLIGIDKIRERLLEAGVETVSQTRLYVTAKNFLSTTDFRTIMEIMFELEMVQKFETSSGVGRPGTYYRATKTITAKGMMDTVLREMNQR